MIFLGIFKAGSTVKYRANFHNEDGTIENPLVPEAQMETPAGVFSNLTTPAIVNAKTGHYGGSIDTTGFVSGQYFVRLAGTVTTAKTTATEFCFVIVTNEVSDVPSLVWNALTSGYGISGSYGEKLEGINSGSGIVNYAPDIATRVIGDNEGGDVNSLSVLDDVYMITGEVVGTGLDVTVERSTSSIAEVPSVLRVTGYYNGSSIHQMNVYIWNYVTSAWDLKGIMSDRSSAFSYIFPMGPDNQNPLTGQMRVRFLHNTTTYFASHSLRLDYVTFEKSQFVDPLASDVAAIRAKTDQLNFNLTNVNAYIANTSNLQAALPNLDAAVSTRLASSGYVAPDNTGISEIQDYVEFHLDVVVSSRMSALSYVAPANSDIMAIKAKTDQLTFTVPTRVDASAEITAGQITDIAEAVAAEVGPEIWSAPVRSLTQSISQVAAILAGTNINALRGDSWTIALTGIGALTGRTKLWFTVKVSKDDLDSASVIQITEDDGLVVLNGAVVPPTTPAPGDPENAWGEVVVDNETLGNITITLVGLATKLLSEQSLFYDVQILDADDNPHTKVSGVMQITADVTREVE
jgi:hypothetical protein